MTKRISTLLLATVAAAAMAAPARAGDTMRINGAGATFPYPIYSKWFSAYNKLHPDVQINYQSIGSGGGIRQLTEQTVFFGASDGPMTDEQLAAAPMKILHLPTVLGGVVPTYNVPEVTGEIRLSGPVLAGIFLGDIRKWNDPAIAADNPGLKLPDREITVVHRSDGSGTSYIWCDYLSKVSPAYKEKVGVATSVNWPVGIGGKGNEGVAGLVKQTPYSLGYVELIYALHNDLSYGAVKSHDGEWLRASLETVTAAAQGAAASMPDDFRVSITNAPGKGAYPISSFTWLLVQEHPKDEARGATLDGFIKWALTDGQRYCAELGYAPLPKEVVSMEMGVLRKTS